MLSVAPFWILANRWDVLANVEQMCNDSQLRHASESAKKLIKTQIARPNAQSF